MPKISKATASIRQEIPGAISLSENLAGGWTVNFETETADVDTAELYRDLPGGLCQATHLGYVFKGTITYRDADGVDETFTEGDAYIVQPGHTALVRRGTEYLEFSSTKEHASTYRYMVETWGFLEPGDPLIIAP